MKKTIIAIALILVIACVLFTACKTKNSGEETTTETTTIEIFTDSETGEKYVTNNNGDRIPVTTDVDGAIDFVEELVTKTVEQVSKEAEVIESKKQDAATTRAQIPETTTLPSPVDDSNGIEIGNGDVFEDGHAAVIDWG